MECVSLVEAEVLVFQSSIVWWKVNIYMLLLLTVFTVAETVALQSVPMASFFVHLLARIPGQVIPHVLMSSREFHLVLIKHGRDMQSLGVQVLTSAVSAAGARLLRTKT